MTRRMLLFSIVLSLAASLCVFAQAGAAEVRNYVGLINQSYHPGLVAHLETAREELRRRGESDIVRAIDIIISGAVGSGFLYSDDDENFFVITNHHVIAQAYTVSITFEHPDGNRTRIDNLRIIAVDEEADLAILAFPDGEMPLVSRGLTFIERNIQEGEEIFSAGFSGLGITPLWQFGGGMVSNAFARFPRSLDDPTLMGPFIQHTAPIDGGNSGGPLLVVQSNAPSGYAVAGINTLSTFRVAGRLEYPI